MLYPVRPPTVSEGSRQASSKGENSRLTLEVLHNVQEAVVDVRLFDELNLDLIQVTQRVLYGFIHGDLSVEQFPTKGQEIASQARSTEPSGR